MYQLYTPLFRRFSSCLMPFMKDMRWALRTCLKPPENRDPALRIMPTNHCELCQPAVLADANQVVYQHSQYRVILVEEAQYPGFCRVIWQQHVREMTDLSLSERQLLMEAVWKTEQAIHTVLQPYKINLASLGNLVPHLHWHIIPRYVDDAHFPAPIWAASERALPEEMRVHRVALLPALRLELQKCHAALEV